MALASILRTTAWWSRPTRVRAGRSPKNGGGPFASGITIVKPTAKTIRDGSYPISRTLFIYPNNAKLSENSTFKDFMDFYMTKKNLTDTVEQAGYVTLDSADLKSSISTYKGIGG